MQPILNFAQQAWDQQAERFIKVIESMPDEALTWQPTSAETNSVAQLVRHTFGSLPLLLGLARGDAPPPAPEQMREMAARLWRNDAATKEDLIDQIKGSLAQRDRVLAQLDEMDLNEEVAGLRGTRPRTAMVAGFVSHSAEHVGHVELTKQVWEAQQP